MRVIDYFDRTVIAAPDKTAFIDKQGSYTYAEMREFSNAIAVALQTSAMADMAGIAVYSPNSSDAFACVLAAFRAGGTWVPINAKNALESAWAFEPPRPLKVPIDVIVEHAVMLRRVVVAECWRLDEVGAELHAAHRHNLVHVRLPEHVPRLQ